MEMPIELYRRTRKRRTRSRLHICQDCACDLTHENWSESNQLYGRYICKTCYTAKQKAYSSNPESKNKRRIREREKRLNRSNEEKERQRLVNLDSVSIRKYGMSLADREHLFESQGRRCAICEAKEAGGRGSFHVDHCHSTGRIRGILCLRCNLLLGKANDDITLLLKFIDYIKSKGFVGKNPHLEITTKDRRISPIKYRVAKLKPTNRRGTFKLPSKENPT